MYAFFLTKSLRQKRRRASSFERCFSRAFLLSEGNATRHNKTEICWKEDAVNGRQEGEFISEIKVRINKTGNECTNVRTLAFARMHPRIPYPWMHPSIRRMQKDPWIETSSTEKQKYIDTTLILIYSFFDGDILFAARCFYYYLSFLFVVFLLNSQLLIKIIFNYSC